MNEKTKPLFVNVDTVRNDLGVSRAKAYQVIKELNTELKAMTVKHGVWLSIIPIGRATEKSMKNVVSKPRNLLRNMKQNSLPKENMTSIWGSVRLSTFT